MGAFKLIAYPYAGAVIALCVAFFLGLAAFGPELQQWSDWQSELVSITGTIAVLGGSLIGVWMALRPGTKAPH